MKTTKENNKGEGVQDDSGEIVSRSERTRIARREMLMTNRLSEVLFDINVLLEPHETYTVSKHDVLRWSVMIDTSNHYGHYTWVIMTTLRNFAVANKDLRLCVYEGKVVVNIVTEEDK